MDGARAYDLAREGVAMDLKARDVVIHAARLVEVPDADHAVIEIECGKGTYVRAIVRDLAAALGTRAHVADLRRTRVGAFDESKAITLERLENLCHTGAPLEALLPVVDAFSRGVGAIQSWLDAVGTPIAVQQKLMRHADIRTTMNIYGDVVTNQESEAHSKIVGLALPRA